MNKIALTLSIALLLPLSSAFADVAVQTNVGVNLTGSAAGQDSDEQAEAGVRASAKTTLGTDDDRVGATSSDSEKARLRASTTDEDASTTESRGEDTSAAHRSAVAVFVQSLLRVADRDGGIGAKVRAVAQSQNDSASTTAAAIARVEARNAFLSFLIGTDWKNTGMLRSEIAKAKGDASRLETAISETTDASVKADLQAQLTALQAEQAKVQAFVDAHEKRFSLFGWFTKLFVTSSTTASTTAQ